KDGKKIIKLSFINAEILISDIKKTPITLPVKLLLNALESDESALSSEEQRALYVFFRMRMKEKNIKPKTEEYKNAIKDDIYFNALIIKYGYAITCHKSQGGEWSDIFIDMNTHSNVLSESYYRWAYTAITRSNKNVHCLNVPHINIFGRNLNQNKIIESKNNIEKEKILSLNNEIPHSNKKMEIKTNNLLEEEEKLKTKLASILDQENYKIDTMTSIGNYRIRFEIINKNSEKNTIDIIVNGKRKVTKVETKNKELENKLKSIMGFKLIDNSNIDRESHQQFIKSLKEEMPINISIENIEVKTEYQVLLTFQYSNRYQEINFYFDKYGKFKTATCKNNDKINYIIDELKKIIGEKIRLI
ncbi:MAG: hypothetical protein CMG64_00690, partial [Candidatus Marinimicrobia bacterium]|nr:hypothetical protein [Candidatus Neomarinimicrobiota bacterium]